LDDSEDKGEQSFFGRLGSLIFGKGRKRDSKQEIEKILDEVEERGIIEEDQGDMIHNIIELRDTAVREIMVPKVDMVAVDAFSCMDDIVEAINKHGCSRIPVYEGSMDNVIGIVSAKDVLRYWNKAHVHKDIRDLMHKPYFVPEGKRLTDLLDTFRKNRSKMAIIIDEYGNVDGLVTIGDIMEEIVGDIHDEDAKMQESDIVKVSDGVYRVSTKMPCDEFSEAFGVKIPQGEYDTIAGFIAFKLEKIPKSGETMEYMGLLIEVVDADKKRISRLFVHAPSGIKD